ncbi:DNA-binding response regulator [Kitasatospora sp. NPDC087314]|uniref:response regulator transcription factor n=1 Tax=Kitasatospora sp. NPDC087314 TaxID=3364068 RepID=UPI0038218013
MVRILIAEDMVILRRALVALLEMEPDLDVVAELSSGDEIVPTAERLNPDVAVLDIDLPGRDGIEACELLSRTVPGCRSLILTSLGRPGNLRRALNANAAGFLLKDTEPEKLAAAIRAVARGEQVIDPDLALSTLCAGDNPLSSREIEVLRLAADGEDITAIARSLYLAVGTVRNYLTAVSVKLNARNRVDAVRIARDAGWI